MSRPFGILQPNLSSGDRIKNVKARALYKATKKSFSHGVKQHKNSKIKVSKTGVLCATRSNELRQLLHRGYALCEDGRCPCWLEGASVTPRTENNLFTHFVSAYLPTEPAQPFPLLATEGISGNDTSHLNYGYIDVNLIDPSGNLREYSGTRTLTRDSLFPDPLGLYSAFPKNCHHRPGGDKTIFKHNWNHTMVRGKHDIIGDPTVGEGGNGINLAWSNNTKQNYLMSYGPGKRKIFFNICPAKNTCDEECCMCQDVSFNWTGGTDPSFAKAGDSISHLGLEYWVADVLHVKPGYAGQSVQVLHLSFPCGHTWDDTYQINGWPTGATSVALPIGTPQKCVCGTGYTVDCSGNITYPVCAGCG
jgi:hypothetical protein